MELSKAFNRARIEDRTVNELIGLCKGVVADGRVNQKEVEFIQAWLVANQAASQNPVIGTLIERIDVVLKDGLLGDDEAEDLLDTLHAFTGGEHILGEMTKGAKLPLNDPPPPIVWHDKHFCFTGTFAFGNRDICEESVKRLGGHAGLLTRKTDYLVVGVYAISTWIHSKWGRKIEKAAAWREAHNKPAIVSEMAWLSALPEPTTRL